MGEDFYFDKAKNEERLALSRLLNAVGVKICPIKPYCVRILSPTLELFCREEGDERVNYLIEVTVENLLKLI